MYQVSSMSLSVLASHSNSHSVKRSNILFQQVKYSDVSVLNREVRVRLFNTLLEVS